MADFKQSGLLSETLEKEILESAIASARGAVENAVKYGVYRTTAGVLPSEDKSGALVLGGDAHKDRE